MKAKFTRRAGERRPLSIRSWLNRSFIIFTLAMLVILWVLQTVFLDTIYKAITTSQIKEIGGEISAQMFSDDLPETLDSIVSEQQLCAMVVDSHEPGWSHRLIPFPMQHPPDEQPGPLLPLCRCQPERRFLILDAGGRRCRQLGAVRPLGQSGAGRHPGDHQ